jgi:hypothetical protein
MVSPEQVHKAVNLGFHVLILFVFLTIFFFTFIVKKERDAITSELNSAIDENIPTILDSIDQMNTKIGGKTIDWSQVDKISKKIDSKYNNKPDPDIEEHNKKLVRNSIIICSILLLILVGSISYFSLYKKYDIGLKEILIDNLLIAIFVGIVEAIFFINIASKFSPITASDMVTQLIDRTEYQINKQLAPK